ncbi:cytochrome P450 [Lacinutrix neustonica]|uniref:Cytochrome P450 n=1 Tax=Lacinutrix neustonica TaxID=2980107 RepID=A0A9E8MWD7_9FLAO|nr:cytochrome P450 [Lacinutrix neustonica]WAC01827.1 cytochrome P450 [Lacinutrix neustonica]
MGGILFGTTPEVVKKVRTEAYNVYPQEEVPLHYEQLEFLKYADAVAQEAMRLKPTTPQMYMESKTDVVINNLSLPKGTNIILQNKVPQTQEHYFSNANTFSPERWLVNACPMHENHSPNVMRVFGGGPRFCPGMFLAKSEMVVLISVLCKHFDFSLQSDVTDIKERFDFTMYPRKFESNF